MGKLLRVVPLALFLAMNSFANSENPEGLWLFGGLGGGYSSVSSSASVTNVDASKTFNEVKNKVGWDAFGKLSLSYYVEKWVSDFGFGYMWQQYNYKNLDPSTTSLSTVNLAMTLRNVFFEVSPRYRFFDAFQVGPYLQYHYGPDVGHSEKASTSTSNLFYMGAHLNYDIPVDDDWIFRLGAQALFSLNETKRQTMQFNGVIEIGRTLGGSSKATQNEQAEQAPPPPEEDNFDPILEDIPEVPAEAPPQLTQSAPEVKQTAPQQIIVTLPSDKFLFDTGMSHIANKQTRAYLKDYGTLLSKNGTQWKKLEISGHTDNRGTRKVNMELSRARAKTVYDTLAKAGVPKKKMIYKGYAFDKPVARAKNPAAWAKNRRVELKFNGVKATKSMMNDIEKLNTRYGYRAGKAK